MLLRDAGFHGASGVTLMQSTILQRVAAGDSAAVEECLDRYSRLVWSLARKLTSSGADAEDGVQEVFITLWRNAARYDPERCTEATFVTMIARRRLIDLHRGRARRPVSEELPFELDDTSLQHVDRAELVDEAARAQEVLDELRPDEQRVLRFALVEGLTQQEIADHTGIPLGTVKTHARRGLAKVRERLGVETGAGSGSEVRR
jgi:RNA polymerase sigma-70 factor (ECF subfamily)